VQTPIRPIVEDAILGKEAQQEENKKDPNRYWFVGIFRSPLYVAMRRSHESFHASPKRPQAISLYLMQVRTNSLKRS
jgi:hypothetical protein